MKNGFGYRLVGHDGSIDCGVGAGSRATHRQGSVPVCSRRILPLRSSVISCRTASRAGRRTKAAGHRNPDRLVSPDAITGKDQVWQVPLTVRGTKMDKTYSVTLNCNTGEIAYSAPQ